MDEIIFIPTIFSDSEGQQLQVTDFMTHFIREMSVDVNAEYIYLGKVSGKKGLDESKFRRGCKIVSFAAYYAVNPLIEFVLKNFAKIKYKKLKGYV
jgi:hypothetical protein